MIVSGSKAITLREAAGAPSLAKRRVKADDGTIAGFDGSENGSDIFYVPVKGLYYYNLVTALYRQLCVHNGDASLFAEAFSAGGPTESSWYEKHFCHFQCHIDMVILMLTRGTT